MIYFFKNARRGIPFQLYPTIVLALVIITGCKNQDENEARHETAEVVRETIELKVSAPGRVEPGRVVQIKSKASGAILDLPVTEGDEVQAGDLLARLDPEVENKRLAQAEAEIEVIKANISQTLLRLEEARVSLKRMESLESLGAVSSVDLESQEREIKILMEEKIALEARLRAAKENIEEARIRLEDTQVYAPMDGVILTRPVEKGQIISSGISALGEGTLLMTLADLEQIIVRAQVDETDIGRIEPEQLVTIEVEAYPGALFTGKLIRVSPMGRIDRGITVFEAIIEVTDKKRSRLKPMMTASVDITIERIEDALVVPIEALTESGGQTGVYVIKRGIKVFKPVKAGQTTWDKAVIQEGLNEGETVVIGSK